MPTKRYSRRNLFVDTEKNVCSEDKFIHYTLNYNLKLISFKKQSPGGVL